VTVRLFVDEGSLTPGRSVTLPAEEAHYARRVRRVKVGDPVEVLDGRAGVAHATVTAALASACVLEIGAAIERPSGPDRVVLLGRPDPSSTLEALTAASEGGATTIVLVETLYGHHALPSASRIARTLRASQRQCGRPRAPTVEGPVSLTAALARPDAGPRYVASPGAPTRVPSPPEDSAAVVLIGPEGGLSGPEVAQALAAGLLPLSLSPWILRTQTAVSAALARLWTASAQ
jgi:16S rRNA (uracil1498-N3)-methyltransferase